MRLLLTGLAASCYNQDGYLRVVPVVQRWNAGLWLRMTWVRIPPKYRIKQYKFLAVPPRVHLGLVERQRSEGGSSTIAMKIFVGDGIDDRAERQSGLADGCWASRLLRSR